MRSLKMESANNYSDQPTFMFPTWACSTQFSNNNNKSAAHSVCEIIFVNPRTK